ncbi:MAG: cytochrome c [Bacteroidetes bacterium]|nr:cytochrome c [Bacteroidota bacterium]
MAIQTIRCRLVLIGSIALFLMVQSCGETNEVTVETPKSPQEEAKNLYTLNCASCHGMDGKLGGSGSKDLTKSTLSDAEIVNVITNGKNNMPAMKDAIQDPEKIKNVAEFVKTLRK